MERDEQQIIPADLEYGLIEGLSNEMVAKLTKARPESIAKAGRIDGVTPAALMLILSRLRKTGVKKTGKFRTSGTGTSSILRRFISMLIARNTGLILAAAVDFRGS